jgi:hypothetical protein
VGSTNVDRPVVAPTADPHSPRVTTDFAILDEAAFDICLDIDLDSFAAVGTGDHEFIAHRLIVA